MVGKKMKKIINIIIDCLITIMFGALLAITFLKTFYFY